MSLFTHMVYIKTSILEHFQVFDSLKMPIQFSSVEELNE